jgi:putative phage-type endonuclease
MSLTPAELEERQKGIFATDAAPALGLSKYRSPVQVWMEKIGNPMPFEESEAMKMGHIMQPVIARLYEDKYETRLRDLEGTTLWHPKISFMGSHFDYVTADNKTLVEIKNFHPARQKEFGDDGSDDIPMDCLVQCVHEAIVFGVTRVDLAVLFGGQSFKVYPITINPDTADMVIEREEKFWRQVVEREAPAPIDPEETRRLFPRDNGQAVMASGEVAHVVSQLTALRGNMKQAEELENRLITQIQAAMGDAAVLGAPSGDILATWKLSKASRRVDSDALKKAGLYEQYSKETAGSRRFLLKV